MRPLILLPILLLASICSFSQEEEWDVYMAQYDEGPGSVILNMSLKKVAPIKSQPFVVVTGVKFKDCDASGLPTKAAFDKLYLIADSVKAVMTHHGQHTMAGTFTVQCERLDYYFVTDTNGIRKKLQALYASRFKDYQPYINVKVDAAWDYYLKFLYPNEETHEYMGNEKVSMGLQQAGDKLLKPRKVEHWIYCPTEADREKFISFAKANKFAIEEKDYVADVKLHFRVKIAREDKVDPASMTKITLYLRKEADKLKCDYDGWETFVAKD